MINVLGISSYYHDSSATLTIDGHIKAAAQEERFTRVKHDPSFPHQAILYCLKQANIKLHDLDAVIFYDKPMLKFERLLETYLALAPKGFSSFLKAMPIWLKEKLYMKTMLRNELKAIIQAQDPDSFDDRIPLPQLLFSQHHQAHAASAFYPSPFDKAVVLCLDGVGEWATSSVWHGDNESLTPLYEMNFPHSLGLLYSSFTYYCGFRVNSGEYKLMGLAPYGKPIYVDLIYKHLITVKDDGSFALNMKYFDYPTGSAMTNKAFDKLFSGPARDADASTTQKEMDLAASIQQVIEEVVLKIAQFAFQKTGCENLCLAGGVALNCVANGRLEREGPFKSIWIQPAAGDAGGSLGAAMLASHQYFNLPRTIKSNQALDQMQGGYLGPEFADADIISYLQQRDIKFNHLEDSTIFNQVAELINNGAVIGWFQGRMEFGPRALGNRTIIGDPRNQSMQTVMNLKIKNRESFRPFAPAVLAENVSDYFQQDTASPYMLLVAKIQDSLRLKEAEHSLEGFEQLKHKRSTLPAITHVDYSARVQTVHKETNPRFHQLITAFKALTGIGVVINTSFNVRGEPPVCSPKDAVECFLATEMDYVVMNNIILDKKQMLEEHIAEAKLTTFAAD
jgi:carbamoyltransferase